MTKAQGIMRGAAAGFAATVPMTVAMETLRAVLPDERHRRIPPREVVDRAIDNAIETTGAGRELDNVDRLVLTTVAHFALGTVAGALYGGTVRTRRPSIFTGIAYGLAVWALAYGVGLPSLGLHPAAARDTTDRNEVLIVSHVVWGAFLARLSGK